MRHDVQHNQARILEPAAPRELAEPLHAEVPPLPAYLVDTYSWAYLRPRSLHLLDRHLVVNGILWGNYHALVRAACREFSKGDHVLQAASVYGNLSSRLATQVGADGFLDIIDVAPVQVAHCRRKLDGHANVRVRVADAAVPDRVGYDAACCFFLLHEVPDVQKRQIVNALLAAVKPGGKVVFVDYHRPVRWHPLRPVMAAVFRWLEPYASGLVSRSIMEFADRAQDFHWRKETRFGGLYQVVVAQGRRRELAAGGKPAQSGIVRAT
ncbi:MAG: rhodoquinone biosynthesis methyltransferase RquA [Steroidobacteraceae bacterium]